MVTIIYWFTGNIDSLLADTRQSTHMTLNYLTSISIVTKGILESLHGGIARAVCRATVASLLQY